MKLPVYLDYHATTPVDERVFDAMKPWFMENFGNASSSHGFGIKAQAAVEFSRERIARAIGAGPDEIFFTSGATESNNLAVKGLAEANFSPGAHIITCLTEHKAVLDPCKVLEKHGFEVTYLRVNGEGRISLDELEQAIGGKTFLVSLMAANNESGTIHDVEGVGRICARKGVLFHTDATQGIGRIALDVKAMNIGMASLTAHKIYGPKGIGALYVRRDVQGGIIPQFHGGGQEKGIRSGTLNVPGIVALGKAAELAVEEMPEENIRLRKLRDRLLEGLRNQTGDVEVNGVDPVASPEWRLANNLNISFGGIGSDRLMKNIRDVAVSAGSACSSGDAHLSHVLTAMGFERDRIQSAIRFGLGRYTSGEEIDFTIEKFSAAVRTIREYSYT